MPNARQIKQRIKTAKNIAKITKAMQMVSASKMRRAQDQALSARPYAQALKESLETVALYTDKSAHPFFQAHEEGRDVAIMITTDRGLCGNLNTNILKQVITWEKTAHKPLFIVIGKKGLSLLKSMGFDVHSAFVDLNDPLKLTDTLPISEIVMNDFSNQNFKSVTLFYTDFISTLSQKPSFLQLLPIPTNSKEHESTESTVQKGLQATEFEFEPSAQEILGELLPYYIENAIFQSFLESKASEHSARMVSMKTASDNAGALVDDLTLVYNKSRQASITGELLDITTAMLSQGKSETV